MSGQLSMSGPPGTRGPAHQIVGSIDRGPVGGVQNRPCRVGSGADTGHHALQPAAVEFDIAVENRDPFRRRGPPPAVDGAGEAGILSHLDHAARARPRELRRAIGRGIIDNHDFRERNRLPGNAFEKAFQQVRAIVNWDDRREHSKL